MQDLTSNTFGKFNGNEQKYVTEALDSNLENKVSLTRDLKRRFLKNLLVSIQLLVILVLLDCMQLFLRLELSLEMK